MVKPFSNILCCNMTILNLKSSSNVDSHLFKLNHLISDFHNGIKCTLYYQTTFLFFLIYLLDLLSLNFYMLLELLFLFETT